MVGDAQQSDVVVVEMQEVSEMTLLHRKIEELRNEKESLEQKLESRISQLDGLRIAYSEECKSSVEERRELQSKLKELQHKDSLLQEKDSIIQLRDSELKQKDTELQRKEEEIESLTKKSAVTWLNLRPRLKRIPRSLRLWY